MASQTKNQPQASCQPVREEFGGLGGEIDLGLMNPEYVDVARELTERLAADPEYTGTHNPLELKNGNGARRVISSLGCTSCGLAGVCSIESTLQTIESEGQHAKRREMLASSPRWLAAARLSRANIDVQTAQALVKDPDILDSLEDMGVTLDDLLGGVTNRLAGTYRKPDLPELKHIKGFDKSPLAAHDIETSNGHHFQVIEAAEPPEKNDDLKEYFILCSKLLAKAMELGPDKQPQIMREDHKIQKAIRRYSSGTLYEIRAHGKNRLYFTLLPAPEGKQGPTARIVILGSHGGDASAQQNFINSLI